MKNNDEIRFAAEMTLGKLAKWLRILGFDTLYQPDLTADKLIGVEEGRILLSRTMRIRELKPSRKLIFILSDKLLDQLLEVVQTLDITRKDIRPFSRCVRCNTRIQKMDRDTVREMVPDYIWETHHAFRSCGRCGRIYWAGTHIQRSHDFLKKVFK